MTRLEKLKEEKRIINDSKVFCCLSLDLKHKINSYYDHEIDCIELYGSSNPEIQEKFLKSP